MKDEKQKDAVRERIYAAETAANAAALLLWAAGLASPRVALLRLERARRELRKAHWALLCAQQMVDDLSSESASSEALTETAPGCVVEFCGCRVRGKFPGAPVACSGAGRNGGAS